MTRWILKAALWINRHPFWGLLSGLSVLLCGALAGANQLNLSNDLIDLLPGEHPEVSKYRNAISEFNPLNRTFFAISGGDHNELISVGDEFAQALTDSGLFGQIRYKWNPDEALRSIRVLTAHRAALFSPEAQAKTERALEPEQIKSALASWKRNLTESPAPYLSQVFLNDPVSVNRFLFEKLKALQSFGSGLQTYRGRLFSSDGKHLLIMAYPTTSATKAKSSHIFTETIEQLVHTASTQKIRIAWLGSHRFASKNELQMRSDVGWATSISLAGILILSILVFRRRLLPLVALTPVLCAILVSISIVPWFHNPISLISIGIGSILLGLSIDYGLHILFHLDEYNKIDSSAISQVLTQLAKPLSISAGTTIAAFACLLFSDLPSYRQFGAIASVGMAAAWLFALLFLPALAAMLPARTRSALLPVDRILLPVLAFGQRHYIVILLGLIMATVLAIPGIFRVKADGDVSKLYLSNQQLKEEMELVNTAFGNAMNSVTIIAKGRDIESALEANQVLTRRLQELKSQGLVDSFFTLSLFLPSIKTQMENIKRWNNFWNVQRVSALKEILLPAGKQLGMRMSAFKGFLTRLSEKNHSIIDVNSYDGTPLEDLLHSQISQTEGAKILANARLDKGVDSATFVKQLHMNPKIVDVINPQGFVRDMIALIFSELRVLATLAVISVVILLIVFQGIQSALIMSLPLFVSLIWTFGVMGWLAVPLNVMNCVIILLIFGLVVDYSVFLSSALRSKGQEATGRATGAISISALTTIFAVGALAMADHPALKAVGLTTLIGLGSGFLAVLFAIPAALEALQKSIGKTNS